jgi:hypothetical protein
MLGLLGVFGALFAGFMADGLISSAKANSDDDATPDEENPDEAAEQPEGADMLAFVYGDPDEAAQIPLPAETDTPPEDDAATVKLEAEAEPNVKAEPNVEA